MRTADHNSLPGLFHCTSHLLQNTQKLQISLRVVHVNMPDEHAAARNRGGGIKITGRGHIGLHRILRSVIHGAP